MSGPLPLKFVLSAQRLEQLPPSRAELAVVGRSNVGKSSLINVLGGSSKLALTSKTPGRTRLLNQFSLGKDTTVVDCPGYGYAKASGSTRQAFQAMAERYLLEREELVGVLCLVDGEIGPTKLDVQLLDWLRANERTVHVVATKHDKVKAISARQAQGRSRRRMRRRTRRGRVGEFRQGRRYRPPARAGAALAGEVSAVALVTGGGRGIGAATCVRLAEAGWDVVVGYRTDGDAANEVRIACEAYGVRSLAVAGDVSLASDVEATFKAADQLGQLGCLVNNAGVVDAAAPVAEMAPERIERMFAVNAVGPFLCARLAVHRMSTATGGTGGVIVNVSSGASRIGSPNNYVDYAASKAAVDLLTIGLAKEVAGDGIRVNAVRPGIVDTEIHASGGQPNRAKDLASSIPMGRAAEPEEIAACHRVVVLDRSVIRDGSDSGREWGTMTDDELTALALAAPPLVDAGDDAVSVWDVLQDDGRDLTAMLPGWYQPGAMRRPTLLVGWRRRVVLGTVIAFVALNAFGLCSTYGHVVFA